MHHGGFHYDEKERCRWQNPERILNEVGLKKSSVFVDLGCGEGFFTIPACKIVGETGKVFALDIDEQAISVLLRKAHDEHLMNLVARVGSAEDTIFCKGCADMVFFGIVLHDFKMLSRVLENARKMLKPSGLLVDLDWKKEPMPFGPPVGIRFSEGQAAGFLEKAGFQVEEARFSGSYNYLLLARPLPAKS